MARNGTQTWCRGRLRKGFTSSAMTGRRGLHRMLTELVGLHGSSGLPPGDGRASQRRLSPRRGVTLLHVVSAGQTPKRGV